jgi:hypothetical protein
LLQKTCDTLPESQILSESEPELEPQIPHTPYQRACDTDRPPNVKKSKKNHLNITHNTEYSWEIVAKYVGYWELNRGVGGGIE